jgi:hypothetical protein
VRHFLLAFVLASSATAAGHPPPAKAPGLVFWAWERPTDLRFLAGTGATVAFLDRTVIISTKQPGRILTLPRRQPLRVDPESPLVAVVRIESDVPAPDPALVRSVTGELIDAARLSRVTMLQIDFDATRSQRPFYAALLRDARSQLPRHIKLSVTALASWCSDDEWIDVTTVDEIVPMLFQMGPDARRIVTRLQEQRRWPVARCNQTIGRSIDERWGGLPVVERQYLFSPQSWRAADLRTAMTMARGE